jgi:plastocyanin
VGKRRIAWSALAAAVAACVLGVAWLRRGGLSADRAPGSVETFVARRLVRLSIPAGQAAARSPFEADPEAWRAAADVFRGSCAGCHAADGRGGSAVGPHMYPPVPDLADPAIQGLSDGELFAVIRHGVRWTGMPAFRSALGAEDTWRLVAFVRRVPRLTAADLAQTPPAGASVVMDGTRFAPEELTVALGETVTWRNNDPFPHNVAARSGAFRSEDLEPEGRWQVRPTQRGVFAYACTLHPGMNGVLRVE